MNAATENKSADDARQQSISMTEVNGEKWGEQREDNYGYSSEEERKAKRGLEDWELVEYVPKSQKGVPRWFIAVIVAVLLVAIGLSFPFWGDRPGYERAWVDWGFGAAILYLVVFGGFVYFMVNHYSPSVDGAEDNDVDPSRHTQNNKTDKTKSEEKARANGAEGKR